MLPIDDVAREAFAVLGQKGVISASARHSCSECTQPYRGPANEDGMDVDHCKGDCKVELNQILAGDPKSIYY